MTALYDFTGETCEFYGRTLRQIRALKDLPMHSVEVGDVGGWIEKEDNLPQASLAWIFPRMKVCGYSTVRGGVMHGGEMHGGEMWGGVMHGGEMWGGVMHGGEMWGGVMRGGVMHGGEMHGGEMWGGVMWGGVMHGGVMRKDAIFIAGLRWLVFINDGEMTIGCQHRTLEKWWKASDAAINKMDCDALDFWRANKAMLQSLCAATARDSGLCAGLAIDALATA